MAKFRYRMQSILGIKEKLESQAKEEYAFAKAALDEENAKLDHLYERKAGYEKQAAEHLQGTLNVQDIADNKTAILRMDEFIAEQKKQVRLAEEKVNRAQDKLQVAMQERKMHEKLKEYAFEEFLEEVKKQESKEVDELVSYTYGQRIAEAKKQDADISGR